MYSSFIQQHKIVVAKEIPGPKKLLLKFVIVKNVT